MQRYGSQKIHQEKTALWLFYAVHLNSLSTNPTKWFKHTQTIRRQELTNYISVLDHFVGLALKGLITILAIISKKIFLSKHEPPLNSNLIGGNGLGSKICLVQFV